MKKQQRKELSDTLYQLIDAHLSTHNARAADKVQKTIRSSARSIAKKFARALKNPAIGKKKNAKKSVSSRTAARK